MVVNHEFIFLFSLGIIFALALAHIIPNLRNLLYVHILFNRYHKRDLTKPLPSINVFVPCKGTFPKLKENLEAVAQQEYENFTVTFISESKEEPANREIKYIVRRYPHCQHVISGLAVSCGQKNYNLLKGLAKESKGEVFVFCDADIRPSPKWLSTIVSSLDANDISIATGFMWITPPHQALVSTLYSMMVAYLAIFMSNNSMRLIWGGAVAIRSSTFEQLGVAQEWARTISDDLILSRLLRHTKIKKVHDPRCLTVSNESMSSVRRVIEWFTRQTLFLKFYRHSFWLAALAVYVPSSLMIMMAIPLIVAGLFYDSLRPIAFVCLGFSLIVMLSHTSMKLTYRDNQSVLQWFLVSPLAQWIATYCLIKTIFIRWIQWSNVMYRLDRKGRVVGINRKVKYNVKS